MPGEKYIRPGVACFSTRAEVIEALAHNHRTYRKTKLNDMGNLVDVEISNIDSERSKANYIELPWQELQEVQLSKLTAANIDIKNIDSVDQKRIAKILNEEDLILAKDVHQRLDELLASCKTNDSRVKYIMIEIVISPSADALPKPEFKRSIFPQKWDDQWYKTCVGFYSDCRKAMVGKFGLKNILSGALHVDETTPHCHFMIIPRVRMEYSRKSRGRGIDKTKKYRLSKNHYLGTSTNVEGEIIREKKIRTRSGEDYGYAALHTYVQKEVGTKWNLSRGTRGIATQHVPPKRLRKIVGNIYGETESIYGKPPLGMAEREIWDKQVVDEITSLRVRNKIEIENLQNARASIERLQKKIESQTQQIRNLDLHLVMQSLGYLKDPNGRADSKPGTFYHTRVGEVSIDEAGLKFRIQTDGKNIAYGKGAISLVKAIEYPNRTDGFESSCRLLGSFVDRERVILERDIYVQDVPAPFTAQELESKIAPDSSFKDWALKNLVARGYDPELLGRLFDSGQIWVNQDRRLCCLYSAISQISGNPRFSGENSRLGVVVSGIDHSYERWYDLRENDDWDTTRILRSLSSFETSKGDSNRIMLCENPLDALFLSSIYPNENITAVNFKDRLQKIEDIPYLPQLSYLTNKTIILTGGDDDLKKNIMTGARDAHSIWETRGLLTYKPQIIFRPKLRGVQYWVNLDPRKINQIFADVWDLLSEDSNRGIKHLPDLYDKNIPQNGPSPDMD